jgi:hypothetical protein
VVRALSATQACQSRSHDCDTSTFKLHGFLRQPDALPSLPISLETQSAIQIPPKMTGLKQLSDAELQAFSDPDRPYADAIRDLEQKDAVRHSAENDFEKGIRLKTILDSLEQQAKQEPSWQLLSLLINCECRLWSLYAKTPIRYNPFLVHWVETLQRMDKTKGAYKEVGGGLGNAISAEDIARVRMEWIKRLLLAKDMAEYRYSTPRALYHEVVTQGMRIPFDPRPYIDMLVEEGIYDQQPESKLESKPALNTPVVDGDAVESRDRQRGNAVLPTTSKPAVLAGRDKNDQPRIIASKQWKQDMYSRLRNEPDTTLQEITRLPLELSFLDFLNELLTERTLESHGIDPAPIVTGYIQHSLRLIEMMESPPPASSENSSPGDGTNGAAPDVTIWEYGKEAQIRSVRLLLLFIKNLIRKGLLAPEVLYFEIQEVCVRYVWIKEVRDFRTWVEEGDPGPEAG